MSGFVDWAASRFIADAEKTGNKQNLLKILREETEQQWWARVGPAIMDQLAMSYVFTTGSPHIVACGFEEDAIAVFRKLKELLAKEITTISSASNTQQTA